MIPMTTHVLAKVRYMLCKKRRYAYVQVVVQLQIEKGQREPMEDGGFGKQYVALGFGWRDSGYTGHFEWLLKEKKMRTPRSSGLSRSSWELVGYMQRPGMGLPALESSRPDPPQCTHTTAHRTPPHLC